MNINLTPSSNSKTHTTASVEKGDTGASEKSSDTSESFLSKLVALFHGDSSEPADTTKLKDVPSDTDKPEVNATASDVDLEDSDKVDTDKVDIDKADIDKSDTNLPNEHADELLIQSGEDEEGTDLKKVHSRKKEAANLVMGEGQEVLSRLKDANQRLVQQDGKELPASDEEVQSGKGKSSKGTLTEGALDEVISPLVAQQTVQQQSTETVNKETAAQLASHVGQQTVSQNISQDDRTVAGADGTNTPELKATEAAKHHALLNQLMKLDARQMAPLNHGVHPGNSETATMNAIAGNTASVTPLPAGHNSEMNASLLTLQGQNVIPTAGEAEQWSKNQILETLRHKNGSALESVSGQSRGESMAHHLSSMMGQQTGSVMSQARADQVQNPASVYLAKDGAADQLAERVHMMMSKNLKNIDIRLDPPELGKMHIRMNMVGDQTTVHFTVANQHVRDVLENSMSRLRDMLTQQGVQLGETTVQHQGANQQQGYASSGREQAMASTSHIKDSLFPEDNLDTDVKLDLNVATKRDGISYYA